MVKVTVDNMTLEGDAEEVAIVMIALQREQQKALEVDVDALYDSLMATFDDGPEPEAPKDYTPPMVLPKKHDNVLLHTGEVVYVTEADEEHELIFDVARAGDGYNHYRTVGLSDISRILDNEDDAEIIDAQWEKNREAGLLDDGI